MLTCTQCGHKQEEGKFCEACGGTVQVAVQTNHSVETPHLSNQVNDAPSQTAATTQHNATAGNQNQTQETMAKVKSGASQYWTYLVNLIKNPTSTFQSTGNDFINGLVTLILYAITYSLSIYLLGNSVYKSISGFFSSETSLPFFELNARLVFGALVLLAISLGSAFAIMKFAKHQDNFKTVLSQYGGLIVPFLALNVVAVIGGLTGSVSLTMFPLLLSNLFTFIIVPAIYVYEKSGQVSNNGLKVYHSFATVLLVLIVSYVIGNALLSETINQIEQLLNFL